MREEAAGMQARGREYRVSGDGAAARSGKNGYVVMRLIWRPAGARMGRGVRWVREFIVRSRGARATTWVRGVLGAGAPGRGTLVGATSYYDVARG
jgi:hypothetical protein